MRLVVDKVPKVRCPDGRLLVKAIAPGAVNQITEIEVQDFDPFWLRRLRDGDVKKAGAAKKAAPKKTAKAED